MNILLWAGIVTAYPFLLALIMAWNRAAAFGRHPDPPLTLTPEPAVPRPPTMKVGVLGREVRRFEILEHVAADGEILEFHVPPPETTADWTIDEVAELAAAISALPELETTL